MINLTMELNNPKYWIDTLEEINLKNKNLPDSLDLKTLIESLPNHEWTPPHLVKIPKSDGKSLRDIYIFNETDSLIMKVINRILFAKCKNEISDSVYSYMKGKRTFHAAKGIQRMIKDKKLYGVKLDLSNFFLEITQVSIIKALTELIGDYEGFNLMFRLFNLNKYNYKGETITKYLSIMPGSAISSFFANYILRDIDDYISNSTIAYARYSDDLIFFCETQEALNNVIETTKSLIADLGLHINPKKVKFIDSRETIEFLGLEISKDKITVNDKYMRKVKSKIKSICKKERKLFEMGRQCIPNMQRACSSINRFLYGEIFINSLQHSSTRISYAFSNVDSWESFQKLDFYIADQLRFLMSGKHNKTLYHDLSMEKLASFGFIPIVKMYHLFKVDKDIYMNKVSTLFNKSRTDLRYLHFPKAEITERNIRKKYRNFSTLFEKMIKDRNSYFIINDKKVNPEYILFDLPNQQIKFGDITIAKRNVTLIDSLVCCIDEEIVEVSFSESKLGNVQIDESELIHLYLDSQVTIDSSRSIYEYNLFRKYKFMDLVNDLGEDYFNLYECNNLKTSKFMFGVYNYINCNDNFNPNNQKFIKLSEKGYHLIIDTSWGVK